MGRKSHPWAPLKGHHFTMKQQTFGSVKYAITLLNIMTEVQGVLGQNIYFNVFSKSNQYRFLKGRIYGAMGTQARQESIRERRRVTTVGIKISRGGRSAYEFR
jgi:hypothetical protein